MARRVIDHIGDIAEQLREQGAEAERLGRMPDDTAKLLKAAGPIKLLQPKQYGGYEAHPREFAETVMAVAALDGAAGWVCGVVGVHPWQLAFADPKVREEVWGADDNTWMASPYAPTGIAVPTDGGYTFNGRWQFSSGTDHCDWIFLGALLGNADGSVVGGHLIEAFVRPTLEGILIQPPSYLRKRKDPETGLALIDIA